MSLQRRWVAEVIGTFWLVLGGCGSAVLAASFPGLGIGFQGVALAFGLSVVTMAYALGGISGGHFNPAVSLGLLVGGRFPARELPVYVLAQLVGAVLAGGLLYLIAAGNPRFDPGGFASNGYGQLSPGGFSMGAAFLCELVLTAGFLVVIMGVTDSQRASQGFAPLAIGLCLTLIHLVSIPVTNTSVNPARSTGVAIYAGGPWVRQLWLFWLAPLGGGALGAAIYRLLVEQHPFALPRTRRLTVTGPVSPPALQSPS